MPDGEIPSWGPAQATARWWSTSFSTLNLEAAVFDTPAVNVAFEYPAKQAGGKARSRFNLAYDLRQDHNRRVVASGAVAMAFSEEEMIAAINRYLAEPGLDRAERRALAARECGAQAGTAGPRVAELIAELAESPSWRGHGMKVGFISTGWAGSCAPGSPSSPPPSRRRATRWPTWTPAGPRRRKASSGGSAPGCWPTPSPAASTPSSTTSMKKLKPFGLRSLIGGPHATFFGPALMADPATASPPPAGARARNALLDSAPPWRRAASPGASPTSSSRDRTGRGGQPPASPHRRPGPALPFPDFALDPDLARETRARLCCTGLSLQLHLLHETTSGASSRGLGAAVRCPSPRPLPGHHPAPPGPHPGEGPGHLIPG